MQIDASQLTSQAALEFDLVIIGGGPVGISIAHRLLNSGISVGLLESGGTLPELRVQRLNGGQVDGDRYFALDSCRYRMLGGSSTRWGGWCRPLDPIDFERREWIPESGWPIGSQDLEPFYPATAELLELSSPDFSLDRWQRLMPDPLPIEGDSLEHVVFQYSRPTNFADRWAPSVRASPNVSVVLHATATHIDLDADGSHAKLIQVRTANGRPVTIRGKVMILATGGIENARLLLASQTHRRQGLGNEYDLVGRYFMDHSHAPAGQLVPRGAPIDRGFFQKAAYGPDRLRGVLTPTRTTLTRVGLPACGLALESWGHAYHGTPFLGWSPVLTTAPASMYLRLRARRVPGALRLRDGAYAAWGYGRYRRFNRQQGAVIRQGGDARALALYFRTEQLPNAANRVTLSDRRDRFGMPLTRLVYQFRDEARTTILGWLDELRPELERATGSDLVMPPDGWEEDVIGGPHHMGTTRMAASPRHGVVDANCRVHSVSNLYVAGSSVFTTGGYANPMFTTIALAVRLAEHVRRELAAS